MFNGSRFNTTRFDGPRVLTSPTPTPVPSGFSSFNGILFNQVGFDGPLILATPTPTQAPMYPCFSTSINDEDEDTPDIFSTDPSKTTTIPASQV